MNVHSNGERRIFFKPECFSKFFHEVAALENKRIREQNVSSSNEKPQK